MNRRTVLNLLSGALLSAAGPSGGARAASPLVSQQAPQRPGGVGRVLLGDGHLLLALALIHPDPIRFIAAWQGDLVRHSPEIVALYANRFPAAAAIPVVGEASPDTFSVEAALASAPEVAVLGGCYGPGPEDSAAVARLESAGIPVVFVDFYEDALNNTAPSMRLLGRLFGGAAQEKAEAFAAFHESRRARIAERLAEAAPARPTVLLQAHTGVSGWECCWMPGEAGLGRFVTAAGGASISAPLSATMPWVRGSLEYVLASDPALVVTTGGPYLKGRRGLVIGPGIAADAARRSLADVVAASDIAPLTAVRQGRVRGLWHLLHATPLSIVALEALASWFHPTLFADLDPARTLAEINRDFLSVPLDGSFAVSL